MRKIKIDHQYIAYLLLEMLYKEGKVNKDGYGGKRTVFAYGEGRRE